MLKYRNWLRNVALMGATCLAIVACSPMTATTDIDESAYEHCDEVDEVSIVLQWVAQAQFAGYFEAVEGEHYAEQCLDVTVQEGGTNVVPEQVLASGNAEFAVSSSVMSMASRGEGAEMVNISQIFQSGSYLMVAFEDSGIDELTDLEGRTMGSWGGANSLTLQAALAGNGLDYGDDMDIVQQPFDMGLLLNGDIDAAQALTYNEYPQLLQAQNPETGELYTEEDFNVINLQELGYEVLEDGIYTTEGWLESSENVDIAERFLAGTYKGWVGCRDNPEHCVEHVLNRGSSLGEQHQLWMMNEINQMIWPHLQGEVLGNHDQDDWDDSMEIAVEGDAIDEIPEHNDVVRQDIHRAAVERLEDHDIDLYGQSYEPLSLEFD